MEIKYMTDAELVEAVALEILKFGSDWRLTTIGQDEEPCMVWEQHRAYEGRTYWRPKSDLNDLFMVLEKIDKWYIEKGEEKYFCQVGDNLDISAENDTLPRAVLEACLMAKRGEK